MACKIILTNFNLGSFGCDTCIFNEYCLKGCFGAQYETLGDPFIPIPGVCNFFKQKSSFLLDYYTKLGVIDYLKTITSAEEEYPRIIKFLNMYDNWKREEENKHVG